MIDWASITSSLRTWLITLEIRPNGEAQTNPPTPATPTASVEVVGVTRVGQDQSQQKAGSNTIYTYTGVRELKLLVQAYGLANGALEAISKAQDSLAWESVRELFINAGMSITGDAGIGIEVIRGSDDRALMYLTVNVRTSFEEEIGNIESAQVSATFKDNPTDTTPIEQVFDV